MCGESVCDQAATRALQSPLISIVGRGLAARCEEHRPEANPRAKLHDATGEWQRIEPEHRAVELSLPRCSRKWAAIVWCAIQIPCFQRIWILRWR